MDNTRFYLGFNLVNGIGPARLDRLIERCGSLEAAWHATPAELQAAGLDARSAGALLAARRTLDIDAEIERADQAGVALVSREHASYPAALRQIPSAPPLLYVRGRLAPSDGWSVAVVGTRSPTSYGKEAARRLAGDLAGAGVTIVSGLAIGVDTIAHTAALESGGRSIAVLACGADMVYPERNARLAEQLCQAGAIVSEFPLGARPTPQMFPVRNRLISGLSLGTLVVEAGIGSGALITVEYALEQGRDVFAVPGSIFSKVSQGTHQLIRNGAALVGSANDILEALNLNTIAVQQEIQQAFPDDPAEAALLELVSFEPQHIDELHRASGASVAEVAAMLALLELKGLVRQAGVMQYVRVRELPAAYLAS
ncbi:DNA-processing protein DprA [Kouleothrix sp.]|uniref:DNA-processing protein DprA n=1 Tax=Kouleothrix sp. TaxID=2779161 RepID=UPI003918E0DE